MNYRSLESEIISVYKSNESLLIHMKSHLKQVLMEGTCKIAKIMKIPK